MNGNTTTTYRSAVGRTASEEPQPPLPSSHYHWKHHHNNKKNATSDHPPPTTISEATLTVSILSVYDLPYREPPSYVNLSMILPSSSSNNNNNNNNMINVRTGPPTQRHRDRNSFKFGHSSSSGTPTTTTTNTTTGPAPVTTTTLSNFHEASSSTSSLNRTLTITHSNLSELYHAMAKFEVVYVTTTNPITTTTTTTMKMSSSSLIPTTTTPYITTTTTTSFTSQYPISKCHINETTWNILTCHRIPQSTSYTTNTQTGISNTIQHPIITSTTTTTPKKKKNNKKTTSNKSSTQLLPSAFDYDPSEFTDTARDEEDDDILTPPPTIRIQMTLTGPYRTEIRTLLQYGNLYLQLLDHMEHSITTHPISQFIYTRTIQPIGNLLFPLILDPTNHTSHEMSGRNTITTKSMIYWAIVFLVIPLIVMLCLIVIPIVTGIFMITLPFLFPIIFLSIGLLCVTSCTVFIYYCSSSNPIFGGRQYIYQTMLYPIIQTLLSSKIGQHMVYDIGPRYQPIILLLHQYHIVPVGNTTNIILQKLCLSILIDFIGSSSYFLPGIGECFDIVWAPVQTIFIMALFAKENENDIQHDNPNTPSDTTFTTTTKSDYYSIYHDQINTILPYISFWEEIIPFTDVIPTATIGWFCIYGILPIITTSSPQPQPNSRHNEKNE